jgi:hypothetical protein
MSGSSTVGKISFHKVDRPEDVPASTEQGRFTIAEHAEIQQAFERHLSSAGHGAPVASTEKQPCHIITCAVTKDETVCWYHCVKK